MDYTGFIKLNFPILFINHSSVTTQGINLRNYYHELIVSL